MRKQLKIKWTCNARVDCVDLPLLKAMKKSGCRKISYGIESGDQTVLNNINKNITIEQVLSTFDLMKKARIDSHAFFMIGNPGENKGTVRKTIELAKKINPTTAAFGVTIVYPGTPLYSWAIKNNKLTDNKWYMDYHSKIFFASPETVSKGQLLLENLSPEDQLIAAKMANKQFYFKLTWILNLVLQRKLWFIIRLIKVSPKILCNILRGSKGTN